MSVRPLHVARDVAIVFLLTFFGGVVVGIAGGSGARNMAAIAISNFLFSTVAFTICGALSPQTRWQQLGIVTLLAWILSAVNMLFAPITVFMWLGGLFFMAVTAGIGGALSYAFARPTQLPPPVPAPPIISPVPPVVSVAPPSTPAAAPTEHITPEQTQ